MPSAAKHIRSAIVYQELLQAPVGYWSSAWKTFQTSKASGLRKMLDDVVRDLDLITRAIYATRMGSGNGSHLPVVTGPIVTIRTSKHGLRNFCPAHFLGWITTCPS